MLLIILKQEMYFVMKMNGDIFSCDENGCKEGFYNLNGICFNCSVGSSGCKIYSYTLNEKNEHEYYCSVCLNNEYILNSQGKCQHCSINFCRKCHYNFIEDN